MTKHRIVRSRRKGQAMVEFALAATLMMVMIVGALEMAFMIWTQVTVYYAARAGARYAIVRSKATDLETQIEKQVESNALGLDKALIKVDSSWSPGPERGAQYTITVSYPFTPIAGKLWAAALGSGTISSTGTYTVLN